MAEKKINDNEPALQAELAKHLSMSVRNLREVLKKLKLDHRIDSVRKIRNAYIDYLRGMVSGHKGSDGADLTTVRVENEKIEGQLKALTLLEKLGELVPVADIKPMIDQMIAAFRSDLMTLPDILKTNIDAAYGIDVDIELINEPITNAQERLSSFEADAGEDNNERSEEGSAATEVDDH